MVILSIPTTFYRDFEKTGRHLTLAQRNFDESLKRAGRLNDQFAKLTGHAEDLEEDVHAAVVDPMPATVTEPSAAQLE